MRQDGEEGVIFTKQYTCLYSAFNEAVVCEIRRKDANIRTNYALNALKIPGKLHKKIRQTLKDYVTKYVRNTMR